MTKKQLHYIYGPVFSWRLGRSLGIDPVSQKRKICAFDCVYCQLGRALAQPRRRRIYVPTLDILRELKQVPAGGIDYITFSGNGEPTGAQNLGELIRAVKRLRPEPVAVITNATYLHRKDVRNELSAADFVMAKLDAGSPDMLHRINGPLRSLRMSELVAGIKALRRRFKGVLALQMMFLPENLAQAEVLARLAREIGPEEVQLNTPLRPCGCRPLTRKQIADLKKGVFRGLPVITVYERRKKPVQPFSSSQTLRRRGQKLA